jgi:large subunit ribosomal protein L21
MDLAVIKTGGKQYLVYPGQKIKIEKIEKKEGEEIFFDNVLLIKKGEKIEIGKPLIKGARVRGRIIKQGKGKKITVLKYKPKTRYKVKKGHRQPFSEVEILKIES